MLICLCKTNNECEEKKNTTEKYTKERSTFRRIWIVPMEQRPQQHQQQWQKHKIKAANIPAENQILIDFRFMIIDQNYTCCGFAAIRFKKTNNQIHISNYTLKIGIFNRNRWSTLETTLKIKSLQKKVFGQIKSKSFWSTYRLVECWCFFLQTRKLHLNVISSPKSRFQWK